MYDRKHNQLFEIIRALRFQDGLPLKYWDECLLTTTYIINILLSSVLHFKSPYQLLYNKLPDYQSIKIFGCLCYASIHSPDKLAPRAIQCAFLGYPTYKRGTSCFV